MGGEVIFYILSEHRKQIARTVETRFEEHKLETITTRWFSREYKGESPTVEENSQTMPT